MEISIMQYLSPELFIVVVAMYAVGMGLKRNPVIKDKYIPIVLWIMSVILCLLFLIGSTEIKNLSDLASTLFEALTQGSIIAAYPTYINQLIKQLKKQEGNIQ